MNRYTPGCKCCGGGGEPAGGPLCVCTSVPGSVTITLNIVDGSVVTASLSYVASGDTPPLTPMPPSINRPTPGYYSATIMNVSGDGFVTYSYYRITCIVLSSAASRFVLNTTAMDSSGAVVSTQGIWFWDIGNGTSASTCSPFLLTGGSKVVPTSVVVSATASG